eukprot:CAMPEP_0169266172 /NCGR_PEP_ID=MMETSP1016-20121227/46230_1 /TAXON_ID=342587 /ORGANISM="Karlodinium micrum, Strain CCMP2283" /LENGTH=128 /DNA_ID=CAMNT_0009350009 /DNA_START=46 /DNA_END=429 /DNA_ORIENTATION=-
MDLQSLDEVCNRPVSVTEIGDSERAAKEAVWLARRAERRKNRRSKVDRIRVMNETSAFNSNASRGASGFTSQDSSHSNAVVSDTESQFSMMSSRLVGIAVDMSAPPHRVSNRKIGDKGDWSRCLDAEQ